MPVPYKALIRRCEARAKFHRDRAAALLRLVGEKSLPDIRARYTAASRSAHADCNRYRVLATYLRERNHPSRRTTCYVPTNETEKLARYTRFDFTSILGIDDEDVTIREGVQS